VYVLIVDHEAHARHGLHALLAAWPQLEVVGAAANGVEAMGLVERYWPDVVLKDIPIPAAARSEAEGMDGLEAIRRIKASKASGRRSGSSCWRCTRRHRADAIATGTDTFLLKGCPAQAMLDAIDNHVHPIFS
jgi:DNA-binding NarL/FixJ family response regulator